MCRPRQYELGLSLCGNRTYRQRSNRVFHLVENTLHINELSPSDIEVNSCTDKFLYEEWNVEMIGIESCQVASREGLSQFSGFLFKSGATSHIFIKDTIDS